MANGYSARRDVDMECRVCVRCLESHDEPGTGAHHNKDATYLTTPKVAKQLEEAGLAQIVGFF